VAVLGPGALERVEPGGDLIGIVALELDEQQRVGVALEDGAEGGELELAARQVEDEAVEQLDRGRILRHRVIGRGDRLGRRGEVPDGHDPVRRHRHERDLGLHDDRERPLAPDHDLRGSNTPSATMRSRR
jgi:hypothetical protein